MSSIKSWLGRSIADWVLKIAVLVSLVVGLVTSARLTSYVHCQARYNQQAALATQARSAAYEQDRQAEDAMWNAFAEASKLPPDQARQKSREAFETFIRLRAEATQRRKDHPLPPPPNETCG
jgi:deoxyribodipyrimidine photolyase